MSNTPTNSIDRDQADRMFLEQQIGERAYAIYLERGAEHGHALDDWLQAEQEVRGSRNPMAAA